MPDDDSPSDDAFQLGYAAGKAAKHGDDEHAVRTAAKQTEDEECFIDGYWSAYHKFHS